MHPGKRWVVRADQQAGSWTLHAPRPWDPGEHLALILQPGPAAVLAAFDLPIGVPAAWARVAGVSSFRQVLQRMDDGSWPEFHLPAEHAGQIRPERPFYPRRPGGTSRQQLVDALDLQSADQLRRACDQAIPGAIGTAAPVFWLVGAQQVGKGALSAWREVLIPALGSPHVRLWPMDGALLDLMAPGTTVIAESYPRAAYTWPLAFPRSGWSKRRQADRRARARTARAWITSSGIPIRIAPDMDAVLHTGFGPAASGEDPFDAAMGAIQAIAVLEGAVPDIPEGLPEEVRDIEGWILGRPAG